MIFLYLFADVVLIISETVVSSSQWFVSLTSNDSRGGALILSLEILLHSRIDLTMSHFPSYSAKIFV